MGFGGSALDGGQMKPSAFRKVGTHPGFSEIFEGGFKGKRDVSQVAPYRGE